MPLYFILATLLALFCGASQAYVGPGAGLSLLGALWGLLAAIGAALLFLLVWPLRRLQRKRREKAAAANGETAQRSADPAVHSRPASDAQAETGTQRRD